MLPIIGNSPCAGERAIDRKALNRPDRFIPACAGNRCRAVAMTRVR